MDCKELLPRLLEDGFLCRISSPEEEPLFVITGEGRESLNSFYINIPKSIRNEIAAYVKNNSGKLRNRQECKSEIGGISQIVETAEKDPCGLYKVTKLRG